MARIKGKDLTLFTLRDEAYTPVARCVSCDLDLERSAYTVTGRSLGTWRVVKPARRSWTISASCLFSSESTLLFMAFVYAHPLRISFATRSLASAASPDWRTLFSGQAYIDSLTLTAQNGTIASYSVSLRGTGVLSDEATRFKQFWSGPELWSDPELWGE